MVDIVNLTGQQVEFSWSITRNSNGRLIDTRVHNLDQLVEKMKHTLFVPVNRVSYYYFPLRNLVIRQVATYGYTLSPQTTSNRNPAR